MWMSLLAMLSAAAAAPPSLVAGPAARSADWTTTPLFDVRFEAMRSCSSEAVPGAPAPAASRVWMAANVQFRSKVRGLFVTPRDFSLESGGIVVSARHVKPPALPGCSPVLPQKSLGPKQTARGFVVFEVPQRLLTPESSLVLVYQPTRWGGSRRIELPVRVEPSSYEMARR